MLPTSKNNSATHHPEAQTKEEPTAGSSQTFNVTPLRALEELSWSIMPANTNKKPMLTSWKAFQSRQPSPEEFHRWLKMNPPRWALITGMVSGRITLDFDGEPGCETMRKLEIQPHRKSPGGGFHADFTHPGWHVPTLNAKINEELGVRWPGLDIRGDGGYVLFSGGGYEWLRGPEPHPLDILPADLRQFLGLMQPPAATSPPTPASSNGQPKNGQPAAGELLAIALSRIPHDGRNGAGFWLATQLRDNQYGESDARNVLQQYRAQCPETNKRGEREPYRESEMLATLNQVYSRQPRDPWEGNPRQGEGAPGEGDKNRIDAPAAGDPKTQDQAADQAPAATEEDAAGGKGKTHFVLTRNGVFYVDDETESKIFVCSRLEVLAYARDGESQSWGRLLKWTDPKGREHGWVAPMKILVGDGLAFRETLADGGLTIGNAPKVNHLLSQYVQSERPQRFLICVPQTGWHGKSYIFPESTIPKNSEVIYQTAAPQEHFYATAGTLEKWREAIGRRCAGNSRLVLAVSAAFAGPLLRPLNVQGGGFHIVGTSSTGKSTTQWVAGSVCGGGASHGFARTWRSTQNALESTAEMHNDGLLILDEISEIPETREIDSIVYMLANGSGKSRMTKNITARRTLSWRLLLLSSGEIPLSEHAAAADRKVKGGAEIRLLNIPADAGAGMGIFQNIHGAADSRTFAETLQLEATRNYGEPLRAFLENLIPDWEHNFEQAGKFVTEFIRDNLPPTAAPEIGRALHRFALVACAGEMATRMDITAWKPGEATDAAIECFRAWITERGGTEATDTLNGFHQVRHFIASNHARFYSAAPIEVKNEIVPQRINNAVGYWKKIRPKGLAEYQVFYLLFPDAFRNEVCKGAPTSSKAVLKDLHERKLLLKPEKDRWTYETEVTLPTGAQEELPFIAISGEILKHDKKTRG
jgi:uncharacterized protein (DUF927 family)